MIKIKVLLTSLFCAFSVGATLGLPVTQAVNNPTRPAADVQLDSYRKPKAVLDFFGVTPDMTVLDVYATSGYYTELLSHIVGTNGKVISHNSKGYQKFIGRAVNNRYLNNRLSNVEKYINHPRVIKLIPDSLDMVLMISIYHDLHVSNAKNLITPADRKNLIAQVFKALKSGGILGIVDHDAPRSSGVDAADKWHRLPASIVSKELMSFGFELVGESKALRNHDDPLDISIFHTQVRRKTSRYILKFKKP